MQDGQQVLVPLDAAIENAKYEADVKSLAFSEMTATIIQKTSEFQGQREVVSGALTALNNAKSALSAIPEGEENDSQRSAAQQALNAATKEYEAAVAKQDEMAAELNELKDSHEALQGEIDAIKAELQEYTDEYNQEEEKVDKELEELAELLGETDSDLKEAHEELVKLQAEIEAKEAGAQDAKDGADVALMEYQASDKTASQNVLASITRDADGNVVIADDTAIKGALGLAEEMGVDLPDEPEEAGEGEGDGEAAVAGSPVGVAAAASQGEDETVIPAGYVPRGETGVPAAPEDVVPPTDDVSGDEVALVPTPEGDIEGQGEENAEALAQMLERRGFFNEIQSNDTYNGEFATGLVNEYAELQNKVLAGTATDDEMARVEQIYTDLNTYKGRIDELSEMSNEDTAENKELARQLSANGVVDQFRMELDYRGISIEQAVELSNARVAILTEQAKMIEIYNSTKSALEDMTPTQELLSDMDLYSFDSIAGRWASNPYEVNNLAILNQMACEGADMSQVDEMVSSAKAALFSQIQYMQEIADNLNVDALEQNPKVESFDKNKVKALREMYDRFMQTAYKDSSGWFGWRPGEINETKENAERLLKLALTGDGISGSLDMATITADMERLIEKYAK